MLTVCILGGCGGLERTVLMVSALEGVAVLKELIFTVSNLGVCGGLETTDL